jgi:DNA-binding response OmpR family regulator
MRAGPLRDSLPEHAMLPGGGVQGAAWPTVLVVDHDREMLQTLVCYFEKRGFHVAAATTLAEAKEFCDRRKHWTFVVADYHLPDGTGWELCCWLREWSETETPFLLLSGNPNGATLCAGTDYLAKPFPPEALESRVRALLHRRGSR